MLPALDSEAGVLTLVCGKCTREGKFEGKDRAEASRKAVAAGWGYHGDRMTCPQCPAPHGRTFSFCRTLR